MYVHMYVRTYVFLCVCVSVCVCVRARAHMRTCLHVLSVVYVKDVMCLYPNFYLHGYSLLCLYMVQNFMAQKKNNKCLEGAVPPDFFHVTLLMNGYSLMGKFLTVFETYKNKALDAHLLFLRTVKRWYDIMM